MGNEHSKAKGLQKRGTMNGHASIKANGFTANGGFSPTDEPSAVTSLEESIPPEYVIVEEGPPQTQGGADETDVGPPSVESEPESDMFERDAAVISEDLGQEWQHWKVEISTQTDFKNEAEIATQTGEDDEARVTEVTHATREVDPVGWVIPTFTGDQFLFRAERVEVCDGVGSQTCGEITGQTCHRGLSEINYDLPKVVADVVEAVFTVSAEDADNDKSNKTEEARGRRLTGTVGLESILFNPDIIEKGGAGFSGDALETRALETIPEVVLEETSVAEEVPPSGPTILADEFTTCSATNQEFPVVKLQMESMHEFGADGGWNDPLAEVIEVTPPEMQTSEMGHLGFTMQEIVRMVLDETPKRTGDLSTVEDDAQCVVQVPEVQEVPGVSLHTTNESITETTATQFQPVTGQCDDRAVRESTGDLSMDIIAELDSILTSDEISEGPVDDEAVMKDIPEEAIESLCQALGTCRLTSQEPLARDDLCPLKEDLISAEVFVPLSAELSSPLFPQQQVEVGTTMMRKEADEEAISFLSEEMTADEIKEADSTIEDIKETQEPEEGQSGDGATSDVENEDNGTTQVLENILVSIVDAIGEKLEAIENFVEELGSVSEEKNVDDQAEKEAGSVIITTEPTTVELFSDDVSAELSGPENPQQQVELGTTMMRKEADEEAISFLSEEMTADPDVDEADSTIENIKETQEPEECQSGDGATSDVENEDNGTTQVLENIVVSIVEAIGENLEAIENFVEELGSVSAEKNIEDQAENEVESVIITTETTTVEMFFSDDVSAEIPEEVSSEEVENTVQEPTTPEEVKDIWDCEVSEELSDLKNASVLENIVESIVDAIEENLEVIENIVEELSGEETSSDSVDVTPSRPEVKSVSSISTIVNGVSDSNGSELATLVKTVATCVQPFIETLVVTHPDEKKAKAEEKPTGNTSPVFVNTLLMKLRSACTSVVEESFYKLQDLEITSLGYTITLTLHVAPI